MAIAAIVAGGTGSRMGNTGMPKQFLDLCGKPVIIRTIEAFSEDPSISAVIVGINPDWYDYMSELAEKYCYSDSNSCLMKLGMIGETIVTQTP